MSLSLRASGLASALLLAVAWQGGGGPAGAAEPQRAAFRVNGIRFDVVTLQLRGEPRGIAEALLADWAGAGAGRARLQRRGEAWLVGRQRGSLHETVELRPGRTRGVVEGRVAAVDLAAVPSGAPPLPYRLPPGLQVQRVFEDLDAVGRPVVVLLASRVGVESTWARLRPALERAGFATGALAPAAAGRAGGSAARVIEARGPRLSVEGVIRAHPSGARLVLLHRGRVAEGADAGR